MTFEEIIFKIDNKENFAFSRWGDGEWNCILHPSTRTKNADGHIYFHGLSDALQRVLLSKPKYVLGLQEYAMKINALEISKWLADNELDLKWSDADVFHNASLQAKLEKLMEAVQNRGSAIFVAPQYLSVFPHSEFITVPQVNCWINYYPVLKKLKQELSYFNNAVVIFCCGMMANVMIDEMYHYDPSHTYIDLGSALDPYAGVEKRSYHHKITQRINS